MSEFSQDEIAVLKKISALGMATPESLAHELGEPYTLQGLSAYLESLTKRTLLSKSPKDPSAYELTPLGLIVIGVLPESAKKVYSPVPHEKCFLFYTGVGPDRFTRLSACCLSDFGEKARRVDPTSLEFHVRRGDIAKWFKDVLGEAELAREFDRLRTLNLHGEALRNRITRLTDARIERLTYRRTGV